jgi:hypothetical protein
MLPTERLISTHHAVLKQAHVEKQHGVKDRAGHNSSIVGMKKESFSAEAAHRRQEAPSNKTGT